MQCLPVPEYSALIVIDAQERLCPAMLELEERLTMLRRAVQVAGLLQVSVVVTEQYPQGLGPTVSTIAEVLPKGCRRVEKTSFSSWCCADFATAIEALAPRALVLAGMEMHVCVQHTALDALARGYEVILLADAVCSRRALDRETSLAYLRQQGALITTVEALAFAWVKDSRHPKFRDLVRIVK
ncbi:MAG: hypothetical protein A3K19_15455 [Lentisphaerae bacterium RIFOXYB12_FULL_65_16]|nr:MAG: hypothetical protein A3K18_26490 [Lentisphaerae bacterium RIFOXYA12_64_32]OGV88496.1 MAG: hypothetical protein A3K19_15455 [Lentisphaerae bacterium RIFOXYB12_FULL_65_16]